MRHIPLAMGAAFICVSSVTAFAADDLPDRSRTPGFENSDVTQDNIKKNICKPGWTKTVRPPVKFTNALKKQQLVEFGYTDRNPSHYEEDHLVSLQLGGNPRDARNLWPEPYSGSCGARVKDVLESKLKRLVCKGKITLKEAQEAISKNWIDAYKKYVDPQGC